MPYSSEFPRTVSGGDYRVPLDHPVLEVLAQDIDRLYELADLRKRERGMLLRLYADLVRMDEGLTRYLHESATDPAYIAKLSVRLPCAERRPTRAWMGDAVMGRGLKHNAGFVAFVREYVDRLARKYFGTETDHSADVEDQLAPDQQF